MAKSKISLGKCHIVLENMWVILKYLLIFISNIIPRDKRTDSMISKSLDDDILHLVLCPWLCSSVSWEPEQNLYKTCINLNYAELVHRAF